MHWMEITAERYTKALKSVRPTLWLPFGFLRGGKPPLHRECRREKQTQPAYTPFVTRKASSGKDQNL
jgi:hypothetical protein